MKISDVFVFPGVVLWADCACRQAGPRFRIPVDGKKAAPQKIAGSPLGKFFDAVYELRLTMIRGLSGLRVMPAASGDTDF